MPEKVARRQRAGGTKQAATPRVGIVYLVDDKLWIDATPLTGAGRFNVTSERWFLPFDYISIFPAPHG
jgi:hypothetical protein